MPNTLMIQTCQFIKELILKYFKGVILIYQDLYSRSQDGYSVRL